MEVDPQHLALLPPWLQVALSIVVFVGAAWVYVSGLFKKIPTPPNSKDIAIPAVSLADAGFIQDWIAEMRQGNQNERERLALTREIVFIMKQVNERLEEVQHELRMAMKR